MRASVCLQIGTRHFSDGCALVNYTVDWESAEFKSALHTMLNAGFGGNPPDWVTLTFDRQSLEFDFKLWNNLLHALVAFDLDYESWPGAYGCEPPFKIPK